MGGVAMLLTIVDEIRPMLGLIVVAAISAAAGCLVVYHVWKLYAVRSICVLLIDAWADKMLFLRREENGQLVRDDRCVFSRCNACNSHVRIGSLDRIELETVEQVEAKDTQVNIRLIDSQGHPIDTAIARASNNERALEVVASHAAASG
jgi:hypothetical protein